jgi:uncharacterized protein
MGMKNIIIIVFIVIILGAAFYFTRQYLQNNPGGIFGRGNSVTINDQRINLTLADTEEKRETGLSGRESLGENEGMLFTFDRPGFYGFWMRDMQFPIDIIFINEDKVITIYEDVPPPSEGEILAIYKPEEPADKVLELNAGKVKELGVKKGDTIDLPSN